MKLLLSLNNIANFPIKCPYGCVAESVVLPKTDAHTEALLAAFALCNAYISRPIGARNIKVLQYKLGLYPNLTNKAA